MLIAGGRSSVAWATTKALVRRHDIVLGTHRLKAHQQEQSERVLKDQV
jgi:hypothetical protein